MAIEEKDKVRTVGDIRRLLAGRPDDEPVEGEVFAEDGTAWLIKDIVIRPLPGFGTGPQRAVSICFSHPALDSFVTNDAPLSSFRLR